MHIHQETVCKPKSAIRREIISARCCTLVDAGSRISAENCTASSTVCIYMYICIYIRYIYISIHIYVWIGMYNRYTHTHTHTHMHRVTQHAHPCRHSHVRRKQHRLLHCMDIENKYIYVSEMYVYI